MTTRLALAPLIIAVAVITAPAAGATPGGSQCNQRGGGASMCQKPGHSAIHAEPPQTDRGPSGRLFGPAHLPGFGRGSMPPVAGVD